MPTIMIEKLINAPASGIYKYFTNSTGLRDWFCDVATSDPRVGGRLYMWWNGDYYTSGEFISLIQDQFISFTWFGRGEPHSTIVAIKLKKKKVGTQLTLVHRKLGNNQKWKKIGKTYEKEWIKALENLASVLENGPDLRITTRPMLGITVDDFNPVIAEKIGVPISTGLRLGGVVDGLGAQKAGLQADDVIIGMDGHEITGAATFGSIIQRHKAGDTLEVSFYRCAEKKTTSLILSGRAIPPIPSSGVELSRQVEPTYRHFESEYEAILKDAAEAECAKKPSPTEWSVNEIIAHLIHSELGWQNVMSEIMGGYEGAYDGYGGNIQAHIDGTTSTFSTKDELFKELKNHNGESINMMAHIPDEFVKQKGKFWKLVFQASQITYHMQSHLTQVQAAIQSAKNN